MRHTDAGEKNDAVTLLSALKMATRKLYWACVPDPSLLCPSVWSRPEVLVTSIDTQLLGFHLSENTRNSTNAGCDSVDPQTWKKNISKTLVQTLG